MDQGVDTAAGNAESDVADDMIRNLEDTLHENIISFNVDSSIFHIPKRFLDAPFFDLLLSDTWKDQARKLDGAYVIGGVSATKFSAVLDYLRDKDSFYAQCDEDELSQLVSAFDYFGLDLDMTKARKAMRRHDSEPPFLVTENARAIKLLGAAKFDDLHLVNFILSHYPELSDMVDLRQNSLLHVAAENWKDGNSVLEVLTHFITDPNSKNRDENTPLHIAAAKGHVGAIRILLQDERVDPNVQGAGGLTALHIAAVSDQAEALNVLLLDERVDRNARDRHGKTALHLASGHDKNKAIQVLVRAGFDATLQDNDGRTPLQYGSYNNLARALQEYAAGRRIDQYRRRNAYERINSVGRLPRVCTTFVQENWGSTLIQYGGVEQTLRLKLHDFNRQKLGVPSTINKQ